MENLDLAPTSANHQAKKPHLCPQEISGSVCDRDQKMGSVRRFDCGEVPDQLRPRPLN